MEIRKLNIENLTPAPYNPRKSLEPEDAEYKKLSNSIQEFGYVEPIIWNEQTGNIVGGHQRATILKDAGEVEAEVVVVNLNEHDERILNVLLNRTKGKWDTEKLQTLMHELEEVGADIGLTGFDEWELQGLIDAYDSLDNILEYEPDAGDPEETDGEEDEPEQEGFALDFQIPIEERPAVDAYLDAYPDALAELATAVINFIRRDAGNAD